MNVVSFDQVSIQVSHTLDLISLAMQLDLMTLHDLLDGFSHITQSYINASSLDSFVCRLLDSSEQRVIDPIKRNSEGTINQHTIDMGAKIELHHIIFLENRFISRVGCIVSSAMVHRNTGGESLTSFDTLSFNQLQILGLQLLTNIDQPLSRFNELLSKLSHLSVTFSSSSQIFEISIEKSVFELHLFI